MGLDDVGSIIIDLVREGRRLLTNTYQASASLGAVSPVCFVVFSRDGLVDWLAHRSSRSHPK